MVGGNVHGGVGAGCLGDFAAGDEVLERAAVRLSARGARKRGVRCMQVFRASGPWIPCQGR